jgi:hypothetical protein
MSIIIVVLVIVALGFWLFGSRTSTQAMVACDVCRCDSSFLLKSHERLGAKVCQECAWAEYGRQHNALWATRGHT